jgi:hypothetical protein
MDDSVRAHVRFVSVDGGPGDDTLVATGGNAGLNGGGGRDTLMGGPGSDTLIDGDTSDAHDADLLDGGDGGRDTVSYENRTQPVQVDLADAAPDGEAGEGDIVRSVEYALGGAGGDYLAGGSGSSRLWGNGGPDRLVGRDGRDMLIGGGRNDRLFGGKGADELQGDWGADRFYGGAGNDAHIDGQARGDWHSCGPGSGDHVDEPALSDLLGPDCESASMHVRHVFLYGDPYPEWRGAGFLTFTVGCPTVLGEDDSFSVATSGTITIRESSERRRLLGSGTISDVAGRRCEAQPEPLLVAVDLTPLGRRLVARDRGARVVVSLGVSLRGHGARRAAWSIRLKSSLAAPH